jgi:hypothetical protein
MRSTTLATSELMPLSEAKAHFSTVLAERIRMYESRQQLSFIDRGKAYLNTRYGKTGYLRTKDFLNEMESVGSVSELLALPNAEKYKDGTQLPIILKRCVLFLCGFTELHVKAEAQKIIHGLLSTSIRSPLVGALVAIAPRQAICDIYDKIINSNDYGHSFRAKLNANCEHCSDVALKPVRR